MYSIVIPGYNEEESIIKTVRSVYEVMETHQLTPFEVIVVNDGSQDRTGELAAESGAKVITNPVNTGYGFSLKRGITAAQYNAIIITDADGTYPIDKIPELVGEYNLGFDMVVGARTGEHYWEGIIKASMRLILKFLVEFSTGRSIPDINSGLRIFSRDIASELFCHLSNSFSFTTSITMYFMNNLRFVKYIPIPYHKRVGKTKVRLWPDALRTLQYIIQAMLFSNPIKLFLLIAAIPFLLALLLALASLITFNMTMLYCALGAFLVAILVFSIGLMGDLLRQFSED